MSEWQLVLSLESSLAKEDRVCVRAHTDAYKQEPCSLLSFDLPNPPVELEKGSSLFFAWLSRLVSFPLRCTVIDPELVLRTQTLTSSTPAYTHIHGSPQPRRSDVATEKRAEQMHARREQRAELRREEKRSARCSQGCVRLPLENPQTCTGGLAVKVRGRGHPSLAPRSIPPGAPACTLSSCSHYSSRRARGSFSVFAHSSVHACHKVVSRVLSLLHFLFIQSLPSVHMHFLKTKFFLCIFREHPPPRPPTSPSGLSFSAL